MVTESTGNFSPYQLQNDHAVYWVIVKSIYLSKLCKTFLLDYFTLHPMFHIIQVSINFELDKSRQKFYHSLKEHHKISNMPKFRCEML